MSNEIEEVRIRKLAERYLEKPKYYRLIGKDRLIHLPAVPDQFYLTELSHWLHYFMEATPKAINKIKMDYTVESIGYNKVKKIDFDFNQDKAGVYPIENNRSVTEVQLYEPLNENLLFKSNLLGGELLKYSFCHQRFLNCMTSVVAANHNAFLTTLSKKMNWELRYGKHYYNDALECLRKVQERILYLEEKGLYNIIPELYSLRTHGTLMSVGMGELFKYEVEEWGLLYTNGFSHDTSYWFLVWLKKFIAFHIKGFETLLAKSPYDTIGSPEQIDESKMILIPKDTKEKMKAIQKILKIKESNQSENALQLNPFQSMILLRLLKDAGVFRANANKYELGTAFQILTGYSANNFYNFYHKEKLDSLKDIRKWTKERTGEKLRQELKELKSLLTAIINTSLFELERLQN